MSKSVSLQFLLNDFLKVHHAYGNGKEFHNKISAKISEFGLANIFFEVFEQELENKKFIQKKWNSCELPQLTIYEDDDITLKYHFFIPVGATHNQNATYLIHHHGSYILTSHIFYGKGYRTIEFEKEILNHNDNSYSLKIKKDYFHKYGSSNLVEERIPHIIFNVSNLTASIALWTSSEPIIEGESRLNYTLENDKFIGISETDFIEKVAQDQEFCYNSELHIKTVCYFMQQNGYSNDVFLSRILREINPDSFWIKWLNKLKNNECIQHPYYNSFLNTLGKKIEINLIRNLCE